MLDLQGAPALVMTAQANRESGRAGFELEMVGERIEFFRVNPADEVIYELLFGPDDDGLLEIYVTKAPAKYEFVIDLVPQDDGGSGGDAPAELADALRVDADGEISGEVGQRDAADYYLFDAPSDDFTLSVDVARPTPIPEWELTYSTPTGIGSTSSECNRVPLDPSR